MRSNATWPHRHGDARAALRYAKELAAFEEKGAGLIVMATHGRTGLEHFLMGSVAERVVRSAPCPVFTVKSLSTPRAGRPPVEEGVAQTEA